MIMDNGQLKCTVVGISERRPLSDSCQYHKLKNYDLVGEDEYSPLRDPKSSTSLKVENTSAGTRRNAEWFSAGITLLSGGAILQLCGLQAYNIWLPLCPCLFKALEHRVLGAYAASIFKLRGSF